MWYGIPDTVIIMSKLPVPSSYGFGMVEKGQVRDSSDKKKQYFFYNLGEDGVIKVV